jgi:hypothetical protein
MVSQSREHLIMVLRTERTRKKQKRVEERVRSGKCLGTTRDGSECQETATRRGLCDKCYQHLAYSMRRLDEEKRAAYQARLITAGVLLADREVLSIKDLSVFKRLA